MHEIGVSNLQSDVTIDESRITVWVRRVLEEEGVAEAEISVAFLSDEEMKNLNATYRGEPSTTDVLSFVYDEVPLSGEIVISPARVAHQAREAGVPFETELATVLVHGVLHLLGYDHEGSEEEADVMWDRQSELVKALLT